MTDQIDHLQYCRDVVRSDDRARYDTSLFAPAKVRAKLWVLYAFNQEVAKTRESVSEPALGEIRLQWWRDVLQELQDGKSREHPVVSAMQECLIDDKVFTLLNEIIDARAVDMYDDGPADFVALKNYANSVGGALNEATLRLSFQDQGVIPDDHLIAARAAGCAWAMLGLVRAIPFHWASNRSFVPGQEGQAALAATDADKMYELAAPSINEMIAFVHQEVDRSITLSKGATVQIRHGYLLNALTKLYLGKLGKVAGNPFKLPEVSDLRRIMCLFSASVFGV